MSNQLLKNKKGIIFGALNEDSIAWKIAERCNEEGAEILLSNAPIALRMGKINELAEKINATVVAADITNVEDLEKVFETAQNEFNKIDFILHSVGMSVNVRKHIPYYENKYDFYNKTMDVSAISFHKVMKIALQKNIINKWGSILSLSYIAAQRVFPGYNDMANAKALLESIARNFGYHLGVKNKIRVNTVSQSPTLTTAGKGVAGFNDFVEFAEEVSPLGNADALACADYCVTLFSDLTRYVTMQNLFHDGGFSNTGISEKAINRFMKNG